MTAILLAILGVSLCAAAPDGGGDSDREWDALTRGRRQTADVGGFNLSYVDVGRGPVVLMIHGFAESNYTWRLNAPALADAGFRLIMVDQPGMGRSDVPPEPYLYSVENQAIYILTLMNRLHVDRFDIVANSMGGGIALYIMWRWPKRVGRAVLFSPTCFPRRQWGLHSFLELPGVDEVGAAFVNRWVIQRALNAMFYEKGKVTPRLVDEYSRPLSKKGYVSALVGLGRDYFCPEFRAMSAGYKDINTPIRIVWGEKDRWLNPKDGARLRSRIKTSELTLLPRCGHLPHQERPEECNRLMLEFLRIESPPYPAEKKRW